MDTKNALSLVVAAVAVLAPLSAMVDDFAAGVLRGGFSCERIDEVVVGDVARAANRG